MQIAAGIVLAAAPFAAIVAALLLVERRDRSRWDAIARQISLTDAIHGKFGAIVAPTVERRRWGRWQVVIPIRFSQLEIVPALMTMAQQAVPADAQRSPRALRIVFTPQEEPPTRAHRVATPEQAIKPSENAAAAA